MALDLSSGFGKTAARNAHGAFGALLCVVACSAPAFGQVGGPPSVASVSAFAGCLAGSEGQSIGPNGLLQRTPQPAAGAMPGSKAAAILGGVRSKLDEMRNAQLGTGQPVQNIVPVSATGSMIVQPLSMADCPGVREGPSINASERSFAISDKAILGTLSVTIKHSPFDRDWAAVSTRQSSRKMQHVLAATGARRSGDEGAQVEAVNRWVNRSIAFGEDRDVYRRADYWAPATETLSRGIGDCEDFAIAKMELLAALGIDRDKMRLVIARDLVRNADHAVLVVTLADKAVMLDNMTDRLLDARLPNDYRPIMSFSRNAKWVHGYAVKPAQPVRMAAAFSKPQPAGSDLPDVMTLTREPEMPALSIALLSVPLVLPNGLLSPA